MESIWNLLDKPQVCHKAKTMLMMTLQLSCHVLRNIQSLKFNVGTITANSIIIIILIQIVNTIVKTRIGKVYLNSYTQHHKHSNLPSIASLRNQLHYGELLEEIASTLATRITSKPIECEE